MIFFQNCIFKVRCKNKYVQIAWIKLNYYTDVKQNYLNPMFISSRENKVPNIQILLLLKGKCLQCTYAKEGLRQIIGSNQDFLDIHTY